MALLLKRLYESYFNTLNEKSDPRANDYLLLRSIFPTLLILLLWYKFVFKWGPEYMKHRQPFKLKGLMMLYNIVQIITNGYIVYAALSAIHIVNWRCFPVDYSEDYWARLFLSLCHMYYVLKIADLLDTVFLVLRKKHRHVSFLHTYHHFGMVLVGWFGAKFLGGGHFYFIGTTNAFVHMLLYIYYLITAYDSRFSTILWLKKLITQIQLAQFVFFTLIYGQLAFVEDCGFPKITILIIIPQSLFMIALFGDFYIKNYILGSKKKNKINEKMDS